MPAPAPPAAPPPAAAAGSPPRAPAGGTLLPPEQLPGGGVPRAARAIGSSLFFLFLLPVLHGAAFIAAKSAADDERLDPAVVWALYAVSMYVIPALHLAIAQTPQIWLESAESTVVAAPPDFCCEFVRDPRLFPLWMQQARGVAAGPQLHERRDRSSVQVWGRSWGVPCAKLMQHVTRNCGGVNLQIRRGVNREAFEWVPRLFRDSAVSGVSVSGPMPLSQGVATQLLRFEQIGVPAMIPFAWLVVRFVLRPWHRRLIEVDADVLRAQIELAYRLHRASLPPSAADGKEKKAAGGKVQQPALKEGVTECSAAAVAVGLAPPPPTMADQVIPADRWLAGKFTPVHWMRERLPCCKWRYTHRRVCAADSLAGGGGGSALHEWKKRAEAEKAKAAAARKSGPWGARPGM